jgi:hypothetical protein
MVRFRSCSKAAVASLLAALLLLPTLAQAQSQGATPRPAAAVSSSRRFVVWAPLREEATLWAVWAEDVADQLADYLPAAALPASSLPIHIHILPQAAAGAPPVAELQAYADGRLMQRLLIARDTHSDAEALAGLIGLICNRPAAALQSGSEREQSLAEIPRWLSIGLALNLPLAPRGHYRALAASLWRAGDLPELAELLALRRIPGRATPAQEAGCCALLRWMKSTGQLPHIFVAICRSAAEGSEFGLAELANCLPTWADARDIGAGWEQALAENAHSEELRSYADPRTALTALGRLLANLPEECELSAVAPVALEELPAMRESDWISELSLRTIIKLQHLRRAVDRDLRRLIEDYIEIFDKLASPSGRLLDRLFGFTVSDRRLEKMIARAERRRAGIEARYAEYNDYLDRVEQALYESHGVWRYSPSPEEIEYIDSLGF